MHKENQLVEKIARTVPSLVGRRAAGALRLGIGDDSAILSPGGRNDWVLSCDAFLEGVHFLAKAHPPDSVGYKSLVRAASDLVAMGASPKYFLMTLALPAFRIGTWLDAFLAGMGRAARYLGMRLIGGDTTKSGSVSISITVLGEVSRGRALTAVRRPSGRPYICYRKAGPRPAWPGTCASESGAPERTSRSVASASIPSDSGEAWRMARPDPDRKRDDGHLRRPLDRSHPPLHRQPGGCPHRSPTRAMRFDPSGSFPRGQEGEIERPKWLFMAATTMVCLLRFPVGV